jgi:hypothetical protein
LLRFLNGQKFLELESRLSKLHFLHFSVLIASSSALEVKKFCFQIELLGESVMCISKLFISIHYNISKFLECYVVWTLCEFSYSLNSLNDMNRVNLKENCAIIELLMLDSCIWRLLNVCFLSELQDQWCVLAGLGKIQMYHCRYRKFSVYFRDFYVINHDISFVPNPWNWCWRHLNAMKNLPRKLEFINSRTM